MLLSILLDVLAPILLMIAFGAALRWKFAIDLGTLSKLNIYLFVPAFIFDKVATSSLSWEQMGGVVTITVVQVVTLGLMVWGIGRMLRLSRKTLAAIALAVMFYNSGNYGLPLAQLAFPARTGAHGASDAGAVQAFVLMTQNVLGYTLGLMIAAAAHSGGIGKSIVRIIRMPVLPTLIAALAARWWLQSDEAHRLPVAISKTAGYLSDGLVPIALTTLGAQLASNPRWPRWRPVSLVLVLRLLVGPVQMAALLWGFHALGVGALDLWGENGWPAELLILTAAVPTAITTLLLTLELDGDTDLAADCVFWTTVVSCLTIAGWLVVLRLWFAK
ncbi:MAG TPA: AEC family transporter [Tepidisphaeraceae bacterium]|nr:AEC family transporter [Tepidisphaeraceae bacterium]